MAATDPNYRFLLNLLAGTASSIPNHRAWRWETFIEVASNESLLPAIYKLLEKAGLQSQTPEEVVDFFFAARELNRERNQEILERVRIVAAALNQVGIEPLLLKGVSYLVAGVYEDLADRFLVDIDLLMAKQDIPAALDVLSQLSYSFEKVDPIDHATNHAYAVFSRSDSMTIDLHQTTGLGGSNEVLSASEMLEHSAVVSLQGARVRIPSAEHLATHNIVHSQVHELYRYRIWTPLRPMYDLALLRRRFGPDVDWIAVADRFKKRRLYGAMSLYFRLAEKTVGFDIPLELRRGPLIQLRWWHRQLLRNRPSARLVDPFWFYSAGIKPRTRRLREILDQPGGWTYLRKKLFSVEFFSRLKTDIS